jgi:CheY-like chemotaxis protein/polyhydroxyalkanoate synthesis regulator phasin
VQHWTDEVTAALEQLDVADTLEELRHHIDDLIQRLSKSEVEKPTAASEPQPDPPLDRQIDALGRKVESATSMLAELTDLLESQGERIETLERQLGDPDGADVATALSGLRAPDGSEGEFRCLLGDLRREIDELRRQREDLDSRLDRLAGTVRRLEEAVEDSATGRSEPTGDPPGTVAPGGVGAEPGRVDFDAPLDAVTARRLEDLVEREIRLQHEFAPGAETLPVANRAARPTVMVVDDSVDSRTVLSIYLSRTGYQVVTAASAEDCLAKLRHHSVDAVVLDATMPGGGGAHFLRVLHEDESYRGWAKLPVIVYTAHPETMSRERAKELGASDYLVKGGDMLPLLTTLVRHLEPRGHAEGSPTSEVK